MKFSLIFLFAFSFQGIANNGYSQEKINIQLNRVSLDAALKNIERSSGFRFVYSGEVMDNPALFTLNLKQASLNTIMDQLLAGTGLGYTIKGDKLVLIFSNKKIDFTIAGKVVDDAGNPLSGVSIFEKGTSNGTVTNSAGQFQLVVKNEAAILVVSYVGFQEKEMAVGTNKTPTIVLTRTENSMDGIVVIAYGTASKKAVSTSIASVTAKDIADKPVTNALQALQGVMPGVNIQQGTGAPGDPPQIKVRGMGSLGAGNAPLYVVDGVPLSSGSSFNQINPADIQSIDILKDAASAAIYGSRGGNGVVLVTTKKGRSKTPKFDLSASYGVQQVSKKVDVLNAQEYLDFVKEAYSNAGRQLPDFLNNPASLGNTDWQDHIFRSAPIANYQLSASGASDNVDYFVSGNYIKQEGILKGSGYERYGFRTNLNVKLTPWMKLGVNLAPSYSITDVKPSQGAVNSAMFTTEFGYNPSPSVGAPISLAILAPPIMPVYLANGDYASIYNWPANTPGNLGSIFAFNGQQYNPLQILNLYQDKLKSFKTLGNAFLEVEPVKDLKLKTSFGGEIWASDRAWFIPATLAYDANSYANLSNPVLGNVQSNLSKGTRYSWVWENTANYNKSFNDLHNVDVVVGYAAQKVHADALYATGQSGTATNPFVQYPTNSTAILGGVTGFAENTLVSAFGRVQYNYDYRYMLTAALRRDGSSRFGSDNRFATFPSVSAAWAVDQETFFKNAFPNREISQLKLRASWGKTGNNNIGDFTWLGTMGSANYVFGGGQGAITPGFAQASFNLASLTWETNIQRDFGLELGLLANRILLSADYYHRITKNLLLDANVPGLVGFTTSYKNNVGSIRNRGFELGLNSRNLVGQLKWNTGFNISFNQNKILSLVTDQPIFANVVGSPGYTNAVRQVVGGSIGDFYGLKHIGVYMNAADLANSPKWVSGGQPSGVGDIKYSDENNDGVINVNDIVKIGSPQPKFIYGLTNSLSFNKFDLNIIVQGVYGGQIANAIVRYSNTFLAGNNPLGHARDRWRSESEPGNGMVPRAMAWPGTGNPSQLSQFSSYNLYSGSYLRISNLTLGYDLSSVVFKGRGDKKARAYVTGQNLLTFSKYPGYNPDVNMYGNSDNGQLGIDQGAYPLARTIILGVNIGF